MPTMALVTGTPAVRVPLGMLDRERVGRADLGRQRRSGEAQGGGEGKRRVKTCHAFLPAEGPRLEVEWGGLVWEGTTKWSGR